MRDEPWSSNELLFVLQSLPLRVDGREPKEARRLRFQFIGENGVLVFGGTSAITFATTTCRVSVPTPNRPQEGFLRVVFGTSPGASERALLEQSDLPGFSEEAVFLERVLRDARCVDLESLCIVAGKYVFEIVVQICVLSLDGNRLSFASLAALATLGRFHRPDFTIERRQLGEEHIRFYDPKERPPVPLQLQAYPLIIEYALFFDYRRGSHEVFSVQDPTQREENACHSRLRVVYDPKHQRLLAVRKLAGGYAAVTALPTLMGCIVRAQADAEANWRALYAKLQAHDRHQQAAVDPFWTPSATKEEPKGHAPPFYCVAAHPIPAFETELESAGSRGAPETQPGSATRSEAGLLSGHDEVEQHSETLADKDSWGRNIPAGDVERHGSWRETITKTVSSDDGESSQGLSSRDASDIHRYHRKHVDGAEPFSSADQSTEAGLAQVPPQSASERVRFQAGGVDDHSITAQGAYSPTRDYSLSSDDSGESAEERMQDLTQAARVAVPKRSPPERR
ncbi:hypothetical protein CCYA_CCYA03G1119 [Cyanidiococcus yangmingshanensis]|nr:hypothetical protein CCYA_CCYA03G1119 [Cyanidiococcus yangmingshanensis]